MNELKGFTLMEIVIALVILSIISIMAMPLYRGPALKSQQAIAKVKLFELANQLQEHFDQNKSYSNITITPPEDSHYLFEINRTSQTYHLAAKPKKIMTDDNCGDFYLDQDGEQSVSGSGKTELCW